MAANYAIFPYYVETALGKVPATSIPYRGRKSFSEFSSPVIRSHAGTANAREMGQMAADAIVEDGHGSQTQSLNRRAYSGTPADLAWLFGFGRGDGTHDSL